MTVKAPRNQTPPPPARRPAKDGQADADERARREACLDAGLEETFPASDPVSIISDAD